jgi:hypothetical protein
MNFIFNIKQDDPETIVTNFCNTFYGKMTEGAIFHSLCMFDPHAECTIDGMKFKRPYDMLPLYSKYGVGKLQYKKIEANSQIVNDMLLVSVSGIVIPIAFQGLIGSLTRFTDIFVLKRIGADIMIVNYISKIDK